MPTMANTAALTIATPADPTAAPATVPPVDFGLSYAQKVFLEGYFERYLNAPSKADRRVVATTAAKELILHDRITDKDEALRTRKRVVNWLYDRLARNNTGNTTRYGFLKSVSGRKLWAQKEWTTVKPQIEAALNAPGSTYKHFLPAYNDVTKAKFAALSTTERGYWDLEAKKINEGNASEDAQALYGDMTWSEFVNDVVASAQRWFGAHMVVLAFRPSIKLNTRFAQSIHETRPVKLTERKWIDSHEDGQWSWRAQDYLTWPLTFGDGQPKKPLLITFDTKGEPLLPPLTDFTTAEQHRDVLQMFLTTHYKFATCDPAAAPPYINMPGNGPLLLDKQYFPDTSGSDVYDIYLRKPGSLRGAQRYSWLCHLHARQERYLGGQSILIFRWKSIKVPGKVVDWVPAKYNNDWMLQYATKHGTVLAPVDLGAPLVTPAPTEAPVGVIAGPSTSASRLKKKSKPRKPVRSIDDSEEDPFQSESEDEKDDEDMVEDMVVDSEGEDFTSALDAVSSDEEGVSDLQSGPRTRLSKGKAPVRPLDYKPLGKSNTTEQSLPSSSTSTAHKAPQHVRFDGEDGVAPESEDELDLLFNLVPKAAQVSESAVGIDLQPPSWTGNHLDRRIQYLRAIAPDTHFLMLVDWYAKNATEISPEVSPFTWARWQSDAAHLPEDVHCTLDGASRALGAVTSWRKTADTSFTNLHAFELCLLTSALVYRDVKVAAFHEPDDPNFPSYFNTSLFGSAQFDGLGESFRRITDQIPVEGEQAPSSAAVRDGDRSESISHALKAKRVPKPRKKITEKARLSEKNKKLEQPPPVTTPHHSDNEDARGTKRAPHSPTTPRKGEGKKKHKGNEQVTQLRRGSRDRNPPKRFDDEGDSSLTPVRAKGKGRGGGAQRGKNAGKRGQKR